MPERATPVRFLIRDRDSKFTRDFDTVFRSEGVEIIRTPIRSPKANAVAERFIRTVRSECLDWLLILNQRQLTRVLRVFVQHYNSHRPHRALNLTPPDPRAANATARQLGPTRRRHPPRSPGRTDPRIQPRGMKPNLCTPQALKCLYLTISSLDPTGNGRARWVTRWKAALNAFAITFEDRINLNNN